MYILNKKNNKITKVAKLSLYNLYKLYIKGTKHSVMMSPCLKVVEVILTVYNIYI